MNKKYRIAGSFFDEMAESVKSWFGQGSASNTVASISHGFGAKDFICIRTFTARYWTSMVQIKNNQANVGYVNIGVGRVFSCAEYLGYSSNKMYVAFVDSDGLRKIVSWSENNGMYFQSLRTYNVTMSEFTPQKKQEFIKLQQSLSKLNALLFSAQKIIKALETKSNKTQQEQAFISMYYNYLPTLKNHFDDKYAFPKINLNSSHINGIGNPLIIGVVAVVLLGFAINKGFDYATEKAKIDLIAQQAQVKIQAIASNNETLNKVAQGIITVSDARDIFAGNKLAIETASKAEETLIEQKGAEEQGKQDKWLKMQNMVYAGAGIVALLVLPNLLSTFKKRA